MAANEIQTLDALADALYGPLEEEGSFVPPDLEALDQAAEWMYGPLEQPEEEDQGEFSKGLERGILQTRAAFHAAGAALGDVLGLEEFTRNRVADYERLVAEAEAVGAPEVGRIEDIDSPGKFVAWAANLLGEQVPFIASLVASFGAGAIISRLVGRGLVKAGTAVALANAAQKWGGLGAATTTSVALGTGEVAGERIDEGLELGGGSALAFGAAIGALDIVTPAAVAARFGLKLPVAKKLIERLHTNLRDKTLLQRMGLTAGLGATGEAVTESLQEILGITARQVVDENYDFWGEEQASRVLNAAAGGAFLGFFFGGLAGIRGGGGEGASGGEGTAPAPEVEGGPSPEGGGGAATPSPEGGGTPPSAAEETTPEAVEETPPETEPLGERAEEAGAAEAGPAEIPVVEGFGQETLRDAYRNSVEVFTPSGVEVVDLPAAEEVEAVSLEEDPRFQELRARREELLRRPTSYTKKGFLRKGVAQQLAEIEQEIERLALEFGEPGVAEFLSPLPTEEAVVERDLSALKPGERKILARLEEKDKVEGLSAEEAEKLERLLAKIEGEPPLKRRPADEAALKEIEREVDEQIARSRVRARKGRGRKSNLVAEIEELFEEGPLYAGRRGGRRGGITADEFFEAVGEKRFPVEGRLKLVATAAQLPSRMLQRVAAKRVGKGFLPEAIYDPKSRTTWFILDRIESKERALALYLHEVMVHNGLRMLPKAERKAILEAIVRDMPGAVEAMAKSRGMKVKGNEIELAEEVLAELAELGDYELPVWKKVLAVLREWVRKVFGLKLNEDDLRFFLSGLERRLRAMPGEGMAVNTERLLDPQYLFAARSPEEVKKVTTRLMRGLPDKERFTKAEVLMYLNKVSASKAERALVEAVLADHPERTIFRKELEQGIRSRLVPFEVVYDLGRSTRTYKDAHVDRLPPSVQAGEPVIRTLEFRDGTRVPVGALHWDNPRYAAHTRSMETEDGSVWVFEVQSDIVQRGARIKSTKGFSQVRAHETAAAASEVVKEASKAVNALNTELGAESRVVAELTPKFERLMELSGTRVKNQALLEQLLEAQGPLATLKAVDEIFKEARKIEVDATKDFHAYDFVEAVGKKWDLFAKDIWQRMIQEEVAWLATQGKSTYNLASPELVAKVHEGFIEKRPLARYKKIWEWVQNRYPEGQIIKDEMGNEWYSIPLEEQEQDVHLYFAGRVTTPEAMDAEALGADRATVGRVEGLARVWKNKLLLGVLTWPQIAKKFKLPLVDQYVEQLTQWNATFTDYLEETEFVLEQARKLGKKQEQALWMSLIDITLESDELHKAGEIRRLTPREREKIYAKHGLGLEGRKIVNMLLGGGGFQGLFPRVLDALESGQMLSAAMKVIKDEGKARRFVVEWNIKTAMDGTPLSHREVQMRRDALLEVLSIPEEVKEDLAVQLGRIEEDFRVLRNKDYFPLTRFGKYTVTVKAPVNGMVHDGQAYAEGDTVGFWTFENPKEAELWMKSAEVQKMVKNGGIASLGELLEKEYEFMGLPPSIFEALTKDVALSEEQRNQIRQNLLKQTPGKSFVQHMIHRKGVKGFSLDGRRAFTLYMQSAAKMVARLQWQQPMKNTISRLVEQRQIYAEKLGDTREVDALINAMRKHQEYIFNPGNELASLRALGFLWYLGFNIKSALVNFTQVPLVTYPWLATRYGFKDSFKAISRAIPLATAAMNREKLAQRLPEDLSSAIARGIREGFLDEALATEIAAVVNGPLVERVLPTDKFNRVTAQLSYYGALPFRVTEKLSRRVAFIAAFELAKSRGATYEQAFEVAKNAVRSTLFEYAKWARPAFMRGKKSVFFLFWTFMQHMAFVLFGGEGAKTALLVWLGLFVSAGIQGLPFAENLMDLFDWSATRVKKALGSRDPHTDVRLAIREWLTTFTDNPDIFMHGLSRYYGLGPLHLLNSVGIPVPNVDISGSISLGRMLPGTQELFGPATSVDEKAGRTIIDLMGPVAGIPYMFFKAVGDDNPDSWKRWERAMPSAMKAANRAWRLYEREAEEFKGGGVVVPFDPYDSQHMAELIAQAFGFTPTRLNQRYELRAHQEDLKEFYLSWRKRLLMQYEYVTRVRDPEGLKDVREAIRQFNQAVPHFKLRLTPKVLQRSVEERRRRARARETGIPVEKGLVPVAAEVKRAFPEVQTSP